MGRAVKAGRGACDKTGHGRRRGGIGTRTERSEESATARTFPARTVWRDLFTTGLTALLLVSASVLAGCSDDPAGPEVDASARHVRLVHPADGDTVGNRIRMVAEVSLGEPVWRVVFFADGEPIVIATETPWEAEWIPPGAGSARSYQIHAEAIGAAVRLPSKPVTVWTSDAGAAVWIELPGRSTWVERSPDAFARVRACSEYAPGWTDSSLASFECVWSSPDLARPFHGPLLPLAMLPQHETELSVRIEDPEGSTFATSRFVGTYLHPSEDEPAARTLSLAYAIRARDLERTRALLHSSFLFAPCGGPGTPAREAVPDNPFLGLLSHVLESERLITADWSWQPVLVHRWDASGVEWALVRADRWRWDLVIADAGIETGSAECSGSDGTAYESTAGGASLLWVREPGLPWRLTKWSEHWAPGARSLIEWNDVRPNLVFTSPRTR